MCDICEFIVALCIVSCTTTATIMKMMRTMIGNLSQPILYLRQKELYQESPDTIFSPMFSLNSSSVSKSLVTPSGSYMTLEDIKGYVILSDDVHFAKTKVISLENPLNGVTMPIDEIKRIHEFAKANGIAMHLGWLS